MKLPPDVESRLDELAAQLPRGKGRRVPVTLNLYRHRNGTLQVDVKVEGEPNVHVVKLPMDS